MAGPLGFSPAGAIAAQREKCTYCFVPTVASDHASMGSAGAGAELWMSCFFELTLDDGSVGLSTRRDDPSNREFSSIDNDL